MNIVFRADSSIRIGTGHIMRCLTLAQALREQCKASITFICREHEGHIAEVIREKAFDVFLLSTPDTDFNPDTYPPHAQWLGALQTVDAKQTIEAVQKLDCGKLDWLIVDHYGIEAVWHKEMRPYTKKIMVIDDLADRDLNCDLLLDQTFGIEETLYKNKVVSQCKMLLGSKYALLRPEFAVLRKNTLNRRCELTKPEHLLIAMGGTDPDNVTETVLKTIDFSKWKQVDVVLGAKASHIERVKAICEKYSNITLHLNAKNMAELMSAADLAFGAAGTTAWERCALGLPALITINAENQKKIAAQLEKHKTVLLLGQIQSITSRVICDKLSQVCKNQNLYRSLTLACAQVCDGHGVFRVMEEMVI